MWVVRVAALVVGAWLLVAGVIHLVRVHRRNEDYRKTGRRRRV